MSLSNLAEVRNELKEQTDQHKGTTALFLSGGSDSVLLLLMLLELEADFRCIALDHTFSRGQKLAIDRLAIRHNLRVFSYPPANMYLVGDGASKVSLVEEYAFPQGQLMPFVRDCVQNDERCIHDEAFSGDLVDQAPVAFTLNIFGARKSDRHYILNKPFGAKIRKRGMVTFYAPLWDLSRKNVREGLRSYGEKYPKVDTGTLELCLTCLTATEPVPCPKTGALVNPHSWTPKASLEAFKRKNGLV